MIGGGDGGPFFFKAQQFSFFLKGRGRPVDHMWERVATFNEGGEGRGIFARPK